jgi:hypothetical protein
VVSAYEPARPYPVAFRLFCDKQDRLRVGEMRKDSNGATVDGSPLNALNGRRSRPRPRLAVSLAGVADMADFVQVSGIEHVARRCVTGRAALV